MKADSFFMKTLLSLMTLSAVAARAGDVPVFDFSVFSQVRNQVDLVQTLLERFGDPAAVGAKTAPALLNSLGLTGVGQNGFQLRTSATGSAGVAYDGDGLYVPPGEFFLTTDGQKVERNLEPYKKFDAITRGRAALEKVIEDTEKRRQELRGQIKDTVKQLQSAETVAEIQKLQGALTAQSAELAAIDRERDAALGRILVQKIETDSDFQRQDEARLEEHVVEFRTASERLGKFLIPTAKPLVIPDPRQRVP